MKKFVMILAGVALALTGATTASAKQTLAQRGEAKLARMIGNRVAGVPVTCISAMNSSRIEVIEHVGIVYDAGDTVYVARATDPKALGPWDVPVIDRFGSQLCANDVIRTVDRAGGYITGPVFLNDFVPYTKAG